MIDLFEKIILLKSSNIFNHISTDDLRYVADALIEEKYFSGDIVFEKNDLGDNMYIVVTGEVDIVIKNNSDDCVTTMKAGGCFGEMDLLDDLPRSATARVIEDAVILRLSQPKLRGLLTSYPELSLGMLKSMSLKLRKISNNISQHERSDKK